MIFNAAFNKCSALSDSFGNVNFLSIRSRSQGWAPKYMSQPVIHLYEIVAYLRVSHAICNPCTSLIKMICKKKIQPAKLCSSFPYSSITSSSSISSNSPSLSSSSSWAWTTAGVSSTSHRYRGWDCKLTEVLEGTGP